MQLWAIMLRNASDVFLTQISSRKFIDALEDVLTSSRTNQVVRERLMEVLAAAAFITSSRMCSSMTEFIIIIPFPDHLSEYFLHLRTNFMVFTPANFFHSSEFRFSLMALRRSPPFSQI